MMWGALKRGVFTLYTVLLIYVDILYQQFFFCGAATQRRVMATFLRFLDRTQRRTTVGRTHLNE